MQNPYFFGYGSLVNVETHSYLDPRPATLHGWRRAWRHTDLRPVAFLTAIPAAGSEIEGLIAQVPGADWEALDQREWAYDRLNMDHAISHNMEETPDISVYAVPEERQTGSTDAHPVMLSYLDVVVQGYLKVFGEAGVARFFDTTDGWNAPFINDRSTPRYPRHQVLTRTEQDLVDHFLNSVGTNVQPLT